jgi:hypothetical protein
MTPTERLLSSTLAEEAATITRESLHPLIGPAKELEFQGSGLNRSAQRWRRPLAAVAAAVSVLLVIGLVVVARSLLTATPPFANIGTATSPPRYYVEVDVNGDILVQSTATGRRTDIVATRFRSSTGADAALAVSADGRTYVAAYNDWDTLRTNLFRFTVTSSGQVADFSRLMTGRLPGLTEPSLAISPNWAQLALAGIPDKSPSVEASSGPPRLLVVNLRTGHVRTWHGLAGTGAAYSIEDPAWTTNGSLRFLVMKCHPSRAIPFNATCQGGGPAGPPGPPSGTEWTLNIPQGSAQLGPGRVLVRLPGMTVQTQSGPGTGSVTALQLLHSGGIRIARYDVATGRLLQILYRGAGKSNSAYDGLAVDGSGRYLLINEHLGAFFGWIRDGQFHKLPIHAPFGNNEIVAATW